MINKTLLQSFISKYYLNGLNNSVKWRIKDNILTVYASEKGTACKIELKKFKFEDCDLGIFDTDKLTKLTNTLMGELLITPEKTKAVYNKLHISDQTFDVVYSLADIIIMKKVSYYKDQEEYEVELKLDKEHITNLIKAKQSLSDQDNVTITTFRDIDRGMLCEFTFGDNASYANKIQYKIGGTITRDSIELPFNSDILACILKANKDMDYGEFRMSAEGLIKLDFFSDEITSQYYILRKE